MTERFLTCAVALALTAYACGVLALVVFRPQPYGIFGGLALALSVAGLAVLHASRSRW